MYTQHDVIETMGWGILPCSVVEYLSTYTQHDVIEAMEWGILPCSVVVRLQPTAALSI